MLTMLSSRAMAGMFLGNHSMSWSISARVKGAPSAVPCSSTKPPLAVITTGKGAPTTTIKAPTTRGEYRFGPNHYPEQAYYLREVVKNADVMARTFVDLGMRVVSGRTESHVMLVDLRAKNINGKEAEADALIKSLLAENPKDIEAKSYAAAADLSRKRWPQAKS